MLRIVCIDALRGEGDFGGSEDLVLGSILNKTIFAATLDIYSLKYLLIRVALQGKFAALLSDD
jgi:hypothetical protein